MTREEAEVLGLSDDPSLIDDPIERSASTQVLEARATYLKERQMEALRARKFAFSRVFRDGNASKDDIKIVMDVLRKFCRADASTFHPDARMHAVAEGRREVWLHVQDYCERSMDELFNKLA